MCMWVGAPRRHFHNAAIPGKKVPSKVREICILRRAFARTSPLIGAGSPPSPAGVPRPPERPPRKMYARKSVEGRESRGSLIIADGRSFESFPIITLSCGEKRFITEIMSRGFVHGVGMGVEDCDLYPR